MRWRALLLGALVAAGLGACGRDGAEPWTLQVSGAARLVRDGEVRSLDGGEHRVAAGDRVEVVRGRAVLTLPDDGSLELRQGTGGADDSVLRVGDVPELLDGEMLLLGAADGVAALAGTARMSITDGALRVRRGASVTVGVYGGEPVLESRGRVLDGFRALRQATVTDSGALPGRLQPVTFDRRSPDPWDVRFLGDAIDLDEQIRLRQSAVSANAERSDLTAVVAELAGGALVDRGRSAAETVVGASIARAADGDLAERWRQVFRFRDDGAPWGVVALDQQADRARVLESLDGVVRRLVQRFGGVAAGRTGAAVALGPLGRGPATQPGGAGGPGGSGGDRPTTPTTQPPSGPGPTVPPGAPLPTVPSLPLPTLPGTEPQDPSPPGSGDSTSPLQEVVGTVTEPVGSVVDTAGETVTQVPVVSDVVGELIEPVRSPLLGG